MKSFVQIVTGFKGKNNYESLTLFFAFGTVVFGVESLALCEFRFYFKKETRMSKKRVVVFGISIEQQAVFEAVFSDHRVQILSSFEELLRSSKAADVIVVNIDHIKYPLSTLVQNIKKLGSDAKIIPTTNSSAITRKSIKIPNQGIVFPQAVRSAIEQVSEMLQQ